MMGEEWGVRAWHDRLAVSLGWHRAPPGLTILAARALPQSACVHGPAANSQGVCSLAQRRMRCTQKVSLKLIPKLPNAFGAPTSFSAWRAALPVAKALALPLSSSWMARLIWDTRNESRSV